MTLSNQEIFNRAYSGVIKQGEPAYEFGECVYFDDKNGNMCAAGHVVGKEVASELMSGFWKELVDCDFLSKFDLPFDVNETKQLISDIQEAHDNAEAETRCGGFVDLYKRKMSLVAKKHGLQVNEISC